MLKRLLLGLVFGCVVGGLAAAALIKGLGWLTFPDAGGAVIAYLAALFTGAVTGLVAGKPIWAKGAQIEALLKAFFGALLAAGAMFALRKWAQIDLDLTALSVGKGALGDLPAVSLPAIGGVLGAFYGLDDNDPPQAAKGPARVAEGAAGKARVKGSSSPSADEDDDTGDAAGRRAQKRR